jgi:hypothetical protein
MHDRKGKRARKIAHSSKEWRGELEGEEDATAAKLGNGGVTPAFLALNKSPNKSCVFPKLTRRAQLPFKP